MCFNGNIDHVLGQIENCQNDKDRRKLLEDANACRTCLELENGPAYEQEPGCHCRQRQQLNLKNLYDFIIADVSEAQANYV